MTTRGQINSNFYQIVNVDIDGNPTDIKPEYITNIGNLTSLTVTGNITAGNLSTAGNVTASNLAGNLTGNVSGNVTGNVSGNLTGTTVSVTGNITGANLNGNLYGGNVSASNITANGTISSTGNVTAPFFIGNVVGNISGNLVVPGSNQAVLYNYLGNAGASDAFKFNQDNNTVTIVGPVYGDSFFGDGAGLYNITAANIAGLGNIVTVNLDGDSSNILYGNGVFAPITEVANANFANFAGEAFLVSGSNVSGEVANANYATYSGTAYSVSGANVSGDVSGANHANIADVANSVSGSNVVGDVSGANHANIADVANSVSVGNVTGIGNIATINLDGSTSNVLYGNGIFAPIPTVSNVANANYATYAGTAYSVDAANVVGLGNVALANFDGNGSNALLGNGIFGPVSSVAVAGANTEIQFNDSGNLGASANLTFDTTNNIFRTTNANISGNIILNNSSTDPISAIVSITSNAQLVGSVVNSSSYMRVTEFGSNGQAGVGESISFLRSRGNATSLVACSNNDTTARFQAFAYNSNIYSRIGLMQFSATNIGNSNYKNVDTYTNPGSFLVATGSLNGNLANSAAASALNIMNFSQGGALTIIPGAYAASTGYTAYNYGGNADGSGGSGAVLNLYRSRGDRSANTPAQPNDNLGTVNFGAYTGTAGVRTSSFIQSYVDANATITNGVAPNAHLNISTTNGNVYIGGGTGDLNTGNLTVNSYTITNFDGNSSNVLYANGVFSAGALSPSGSNSMVQYNNNGSFGADANFQYDFSIGRLHVNSANTTIAYLNPSASGAPALYLNGDSSTSNTGAFQLTDSTFSVTIANGSLFPGGAPIFAFNTYQPSGTAIPPQFYKRYGGNISVPIGVANGDQILNQYYQVYGDSGNTNMLLGGVIAAVGNVYAPGNISFNYQIYSQGNPDDKVDVSFPTVNLNGNVTANNVSINSSGFMKLASYTASALTAITGQIGWMAAVSDSASGSNPNGMIAFWDTTNSRWSYVHDNSAV